MIRLAVTDHQLPLDGRPAGSPPSLDERQIADLLCFLETLADDYRPASLRRRLLA